MNGGLGNDDIRAGEGDDTINAGLGNADRADGSNGNDMLIVDYSATLSTVGSQGLNPFNLKVTASRCPNSGQLAE
ncbi:hypothetical protein [Trichocoleus sp. FACHB-262]|uniref:hypothetical protein n=1 Tax=Trichocoleus sp. FACHB-262 TaxID=2692869 RepID=UPI0037DC81AB